MTQLQRRHSGGTYVESDIEKLITEEEPETTRSNRKANSILVIIPVLMILLVFLGVKGACGYKEEMSSTDLFKMEQTELMDRLYHQETYKGESGYKSNMRLHHKRPTTTSDVGLLDLSSLSESNTVSEEILKLDDHIRQNNKPSATALLSKDINVALDLKEMMLISPVTILLDDEVTSSPDKSKFLEILFKSLNINPEPKVVNLSKHPHHSEIVEYLHKYAKHEYGTSGDEAFKDEDNEDEEEDQQAASTREIPRLFVGGLPVGRFSDIIEEYSSNGLIARLKESGKGLISVN